jgi:uncharacterized protein YjcR
MADEELKKLLGEEEPTPPPPEEKKEETQISQEEKEDEELKAKRDELIQLGKAKTEALAELSKIRKEKQKVKQDDDEELPKINMEDPSAKAWDKHIRQNIDPLQAELEKEKEEVRSFALQEFLGDKPALAKNPEKVKELMETYERLHTASERTREGVLLDLRKSYAALFHEELTTAARQARIEQAQKDSVFSDIAISRGTTSYSTPKEEKKYSEPKTEEEKSKVQEWEKSGAPKV